MSTNHEKSTGEFCRGGIWFIPTVVKKTGLASKERSILGKGFPRGNKMEECILGEGAAKARPCGQGEQRSMDVGMQSGGLTEVRGGQITQDLVGHSTNFHL